jgi:hypothetical protein
MRRCKTVVGVCLFFLAVVPAYCQRGTIGIDVGATNDQFDGLPSATGPEFGVDGQIAILTGNPKTGRPPIVVGGEVILPTDTSYHANEYAIFGGPEFPYHNFVFGVHAQIRKITLPPSTVDNQVFARDSMELLELPLVVRYNFLSTRKAWVQMQGAPEFLPRFHNSPAAEALLPHPNLDHGYFLRGTVGYNFGQWYVKATYENRYFKFLENAGNPSNLYNWKTNSITGGVGFAF